MKISTAHTIKTTEAGRTANSTYEIKPRNDRLEFIHETDAQSYGLGCKGCLYFSEEEICENEKGCGLKLIRPNQIECVNVNYSPLKGGE